PGLTGQLAPAFDVGALGDTIVGLLNAPEARQKMSAHCRRVALDEYSLELQAQRYADLYKSLP
ncbi:MAG: glycosyl transferase, partial [Nitrospirota bacterium]